MLPFKRSLATRAATTEDVPGIMAIEQEAFEFPWHEHEVCDAINSPCVIFLVAEDIDRGAIAGYAVAKYGLGTIAEIMSIAVSGYYRRQGVGSILVEEHRLAISRQGNKVLACIVRERNLDAQLFFKAIGFLAVAIIRDLYEVCSEDSIVFASVARGKLP